MSPNWSSIEERWLIEHLKEIQTKFEQNSIHSIANMVKTPKQLFYVINDDFASD